MTRRGEPSWPHAGAASRGQAWRAITASHGRTARPRVGSRRGFARAVLRPGLVLAQEEGGVLLWSANVHVFQNRSK